MKNIVCTIALTMSFALAVAPATAATKVFLLGGQSNMAGLGGFPGDTPQPGYGPDEPLPAPYDVVQTDVKFWNYGEPTTNPWNDNGVNNPTVGTAWASLQNGFGWEPVEFGPEVTFGYRLRQLFPNDSIYLVKCGINGASLAGPWNPTGGATYSLFQARVNAAIQNLINSGLPPTIAGMVWMQGESDAMNHDTAVAYANNLTNLIAAVRHDFNTPDMPFVVGRITEYYGTSTDNSLVQAAEETIPDVVGHASWISTDDLEWAYDGHYGTQGQINLGIRFAEEFTPAPEPSTLVLAGTGLAALAGYWWWKRRSARAGRMKPQVSIALPVMGWAVSVPKGKTAS